MKPTTRTIIVSVLIILVASISFQVLLTQVDAIAWFVIPAIMASIGAGIGAAKASGGSCYPYIPPAGGSQDLCESCQANNLLPCTESRCRSLGQLCNYNKEARKCISIDRGDTTPPKITNCDVRDLSLNEYSASHNPDGCTVTKDIPEISEVFIKLDTDEYALCRFSPDVGKLFDPADKDTAWFEEEAIPSREHFFGVRLANGSAAIIRENCKTNDYCNFYVRCQDQSGNKMLNDYYLKFKVQPAPDLKSPDVWSVSVPSGVAVPSSLTQAEFTMFVDDMTGINECRYSTRDENFNDMQQRFFCNATYNIEEHGFDCTTTFNLSKERDNNFYFRCQDSSERKNTNEASYEFIIKTSQPLQFTKLNLPTGLVTKPTALVEASTNNKALCYFILDNKKEELFNSTDALLHATNIPADNGNHELKVRCIDEAGNEKGDDSSFLTEFTLSPKIKRVYKSSGLVFIQVNQEAKCVYSTTQPELNFKDGIEMQKLQGFTHKVSQQDTNAVVYHIICRNAATNVDSSVYTIYP